MQSNQFFSLFWSMLRHIQIPAMTITVALLLNPHANALDLQQPGDVGPYSVGHLEMKVGERIPTSMYIWYPVDPVDTLGADQTHYRVQGLPFPSNHAFDDVPVAADGKFPTIAHFHGLGAWGAQQPSLAETLASYGFIVAGWTNNANIEPLLNQLEEFDADPNHVLFGKVDSSRSGLIGYSAGAAAAGGRQNDGRVRAMMPISPVAVSPNASETPMFVLTGSLDDTMPESRSLFESRSAGNRYLAEIEGAGHTSYMELCTRIEYADEHYGPESLTVFDPFVDESCTEDHIPNQEAVDLTSFYAAAFFGRYILGETSFGELLTQNYAQTANLPVEIISVPAPSTALLTLAGVAICSVARRRF